MADATSPNLDAVLRIDRADEDLIAALAGAPDLRAERFDGAGIDGGGDLVTVVVSLGGAALTTLVAILRARWSRARFVKIEIDGVKIEGVSPEAVEALMSKLLDDRRARVLPRADDPPGA